MGSLTQQQQPAGSAAVGWLLIYTVDPQRRKPRARAGMCQTDPTVRRLLIPSPAQLWSEGRIQTGRDREGDTERGVLALPGIDPEDPLLQVVDSEPVGPPPRARLLVDGAPALTAHGGGLDAGQAGVPVRPEQDPARRDCEQGQQPVASSPQRIPQDDPCERCPLLPHP